MIIFNTNNFAMQKIGIIDMGTNTFHLLVANVNEGKAKVVKNHKKAVGLGKGGINNNTILPEAMNRAILCLKEFKHYCVQENVEEVLLTGTSAVRNADNQQEFLQAIEKETGWNTLVLSGAQEAAWIYEGVKLALHIPTENALIMDIGGGSVEFIICNHEASLWQESFEIGGQRLMEMFHQQDPITSLDIDRLKQYLFCQLAPLKTAILKAGGVSTLIGASGSFDTLYDIHVLKKGIQTHEHSTSFRLGLHDYHTMAKNIIAKNREERLQIQGMIPLRVDMIVVALILVDCIVEWFQIQHLQLSFYALKEGLLAQLLKGEIKTNSLNKYL